MTFFFLLCLGFYNEWGPWKACYGLDFIHIQVGLTSYLSTLIFSEATFYSLQLSAKKVIKIQLIKKKKEIGVIWSIEKKAGAWFDCSKSDNGN